MAVNKFCKRLDIDTKIAYYINIGYAYSFDDNKLRICYKCFDKIAKELRETSPIIYKGKIIKIVSADTCELCNKSNIFKI